jgi:hypothetical protein
MPRSAAILFPRSTPTDASPRSPPDPKQKSLVPARGRIDDRASQTEQIQRRPDLLDLQHPSRKTSTGENQRTQLFLKASIPS